MKIEDAMDILRNENKLLSFDGETALVVIEDYLKEISIQDKEISIFRNVVETADWLIENLMNVNKNIPVRNLDESIMAYRINMRILNNYERNESNVKDSQAGS